MLCWAQLFAGVGNICIHSKGLHRGTEGFKNWVDDDNYNTSLAAPGVLAHCWQQCIDFNAAKGKNKMWPPRGPQRVQE